MFLRKIKWISFPGCGDGVTPENVKIGVLPDNVNNLAKPYTIWQKVNDSAKVDTMRQNCLQTFILQSNDNSNYGRFILNVVNWTQGKYVFVEKINDENKKKLQVQKKNILICCCWLMNRKI